MLDKSNILNITVFARKEYRERFEKENGNIVDFINREIMKVAETGHRKLTIRFDNYLSNNLTIEKIRDYLEFNHFGAEITFVGVKQVYGKVTGEQMMPEPIYDALCVSW
jgi:hypothetical protein